MKRWAVVALLLCVGGVGALQAQVLPRPSSIGRGLQPVKRDSTDTLNIKWPEPDSVTRELLARPGYVVTRYQGDTAFFDAQRKSIDLLAGRKGLAVVTRDSQTVISDSGIYYAEATRRIVTGGHYILHDPTSGQADIKGSERAEYSLAERSASVSHARFAVNNGDTWYLSTDKAKVVFDSAGRGPTLYARGGSMTSCDDSIPDYHFEYREAKRTGANTLVARPAVLYIKDIPVMWLPFIFSDTRPGRHSGILAPQFGISDIVRNSPTYRRNVEHVGYYFALSNYMDLALWLDWRSGSGEPNPNDPGLLRYNADFNYKWIDRFLSGRIGLGYTNQNDGLTNFAVTWNHQQEFSANSRLTLGLNYVTSTTLQRQNTFNPYTALATITSQASYQTKLGPASISVGGTRKQYPGRVQVDQTFPTLTISTTPIGIGNWFSWTPGFSFNLSETMNMDQPGLLGAWSYSTNPVTGVIDSTRRRGLGAVTSQITFDTPIQLFGRDIRNSFRINQQRNNFPQNVAIYDLNTGVVTENRVFAATYRTDIDWTPDFALPALARNKFNFTPSVSFANVDPGPFWVATERTNGKYVHQSKRVTFGLSASPTLFGRFGGLGPFAAFRHSVQPTVTYTYAPAANVSDEYLLALGRTRKGYLGGLRQNSVTLGLAQNVEAKVRSLVDTLPGATGTTLRLISITMDPITYDFERARQSETRSRYAGFTSDSWGYSINSELLPGFDFSNRFSLFQGDPLSDTAQFKPYLTSVSASLTFGRRQNPFAILTRLFGKAAPEAQAAPAAGTDQVRPRTDAAETRMIAAQPVAGDVNAGDRFIVPPTDGWRASFAFSRSSPRPPVGTNVIQFDPRARCAQVAGNDPLLLETCLQSQLTQPTNDQPVPSTTAGGPAYHIPPTTSLNANVAFNLTPKWATTWQTTYDFERGEFASHIVSLQRELHDWRAVFSFTQSPNGNFAFSFRIALIAEPDLKFDYNRQTVRAPGGTF